MRGRRRVHAHRSPRADRHHRARGTILSGDEVDVAGLRDRRAARVRRQEAVRARLCRGQVDNDRRRGGGHPRRERDRDRLAGSGDAGLPGVEHSHRVEWRQTGRRGGRRGKRCVSTDAVRRRPHSVDLVGDALGAARVVGRRRQMRAVVGVVAVRHEHGRPVPRREVVARGVELGERGVPRVGLGLTRVQARDLRPPDLVSGSDRVDDVLDRVAGARQVGATEARVDRPDVHDHVRRVPPFGAPLRQPTRHRDVGGHAEVPGRHVPASQAAGGPRHDRAEAEVGEVLRQRPVSARWVHAGRQHRVADDRHCTERPGREGDRRRGDRWRRRDGTGRRDRDPGDKTGECS